MTRKMRNWKFHIERFFFAPAGIPVKAQAQQLVLPLFFNIPVYVQALKGILVSIPGKGNMPGGYESRQDFTVEVSKTAGIKSTKAIAGFDTDKALAKREAEYGRITFSFLSNMRTIVTEWAVSPCFTSLLKDFIPISEQPDNNALVRVCWKDAGVLQDNYELRIYLIYE